MPLPYTNSHVASVSHLVVQGAIYRHTLQTLVLFHKCVFLNLKLQLFLGIADFKLSGVPPQPPKLPSPAHALNIFRALFRDVCALHSRPLAEVHAQELAGCPHSNASTR